MLQARTKIWKYQNTILLTRPFTMRDVKKYIPRKCLTAKIQTLGKLVLP